MLDKTLELTQLEPLITLRSFKQGLSNDFSTVRAADRAFEDSLKNLLYQYLFSGGVAIHPTCN